MSQKLVGVKGMRDLLPPETALWSWVEQTARELFFRFGYSEVRTPILEDTSLFVRGVGEQTDIVGKEMYTFEDKGGRSLSLRPEGTAPAVRAYLEHSIAVQEPVTHWFYFGPMFRYERMKTGRYRQFFQIGAEALGVKEPAQDVEVIDWVHQFLEGLKLKGVGLQLNSLGDDQCRPAYQAKLVEYLSSRREQLCEECQRRIDTNPLRVLDCKNPTCEPILAQAPAMEQFLCEPCREHFDEVQRQLEQLQIPFQRNPRMVRGLDYYTRTAFEFVADDPTLGTATAVGGGGRYDKLISSLGGPQVPAVGFALGMDRLLLLLAAQSGPVIPAMDLALVGADPAGTRALSRLASQLRRQGLSVSFDPRGGSLKSQMKRADKSQAMFAVVLGQRELESGEVELKPLRGGTARKIPLSQLAAELKPKGNP